MLWFSHVCGNHQFQSIHWSFIFLSPFPTFQPPFILTYSSNWKPFSFLHQNISKLLLHRHHALPQPEPTNNLPSFRAAPWRRGETSNRSWIWASPRRVSLDSWGSRLGNKLSKEKSNVVPKLPQSCCFQTLQLITGMSFSLEHIAGPPCEFHGKIHGFWWRFSQQNRLSELVIRIHWIVKCSARIYSILMS